MDAIQKQQPIEMKVMPTFKERLAEKRKEQKQTARFYQNEINKASDLQTIEAIIEDIRIDKPEFKFTSFLKIHSNAKSKRALLLRKAKMAEKTKNQVPNS